MQLKCPTTLRLRVVHAPILYLVPYCVVPENIHTPPTEGIGNSGEEGGSKSQKFKAMYEAKLEFLEGWGGHRANPFHGGYGYFLEPHIVTRHSVIFLKLSVSKKAFLS